MWGPGTRHGASSSRRQLALQIHQTQAPSAPKRRGQTSVGQAFQDPAARGFQERGGGRPFTTPASAAGCAATADCRPGDQGHSAARVCSTGSPWGCPRPTYCRTLWRGACSASGDGRGRLAAGTPPVAQQSAGRRFVFFGRKRLSPAPLVPFHHLALSMAMQARRGSCSPRTRLPGEMRASLLVIVVSHSSRKLSRI